MAIHRPEDPAARAPNEGNGRQLEERVAQIIQVELKALCFPPIDVTKAQVIRDQQNRPTEYRIPGNKDSDPIRKIEYNDQDGSIKAVKDWNGNSFSQQPDGTYLLTQRPNGNTTKPIKVKELKLVDDKGTLSYSDGQKTVTLPLPNEKCIIVNAPHLT
jgi:hypothetical protein